MSNPTHIENAKIIGFPEQRQARVGVIRGLCLSDNDNAALLPPPQTELRWPVWKSLIFILGVCGLFWTAIIYGLVQLF